MKDLPGDSKDHQLTVALRIRPMNEAEIEEGATLVAHKVDNQMVVLMDPSEDPDDVLRANRSREKTYMFDVAFDFTATQEDVYVATMKNLIEGVISGYNATVFAYGPTGTGKTYTMLGIDSEPGIYIRTLNDLFKAIEEASEDMDCSVYMSYLEIYNEMIRDLLNPASGYLDLREDAKGEIRIAGITEVSTSNAKEIMQLLTKGNKQRTQEPTAANKTSSRSHAILQVTVKQKSRVKNINEEVRVGKLFMVDLAGTERAAQTQNRGMRMKEGAHINRSMLALANCINALSEKGGKGAQFVNYRDSKLTRLLKDALGGNSRTVMITHISPASTNFEESRNTLIYADKAKNIRTKVKRNLLNVSYHIAQYTSIIADLRKEIERLRAKIDEQGHEQQKNRDKADIRDVQAEVQKHSAEYSRREMGRLREQLLCAFREQMEIRRSLMELEKCNMELHIVMSRHLVTITDWEREKARCAKKWREERRSEKMDKDREWDSGAEELDSTEPQDVLAAREEIATLLAEQRKTTVLKVMQPSCIFLPFLLSFHCRRGWMEELLPKRISNEEQREILALLCRVHELEVENTEIRSMVLCKENALRTKDFVIQRYDQHRSLCDEIIQQQKTIIEDYEIPVPHELEQLYTLYFNELRDGSIDQILSLHTITSSTMLVRLSHNSRSLIQLKGINRPPEGISPETMKAIASDTKSISVVAARRRSRIHNVESGSSLFRAKERSLVSVQSLEEAEESDRAASEPHGTPGIVTVQPAISMDSLAIRTPEGLEVKRLPLRVPGSSQSSSKKELQRADRGMASIERRARKKRSKSFEANLKRKPKISTSRNPVLESISDNRLARHIQNSNQFSLKKGGNPSPPLPATNKKLNGIKYPISHHKGRAFCRAHHLNGS
uniref:Kinesin-like protein KIF19 n=1 Tax=Scleropages formosus TaxID=113540 RepID=A0A8C9WCU5_SCLFO